MSRICCGATLACLVVATLHVAAQRPTAPGTPGATISTPSRFLPGTRPDVFSTIQGNALSSTNGALANAIVRLRDVRMGQIIGTQITDRSGLFVFRAVDPGSYVVEIVAGDQVTVLAASQVLPVNAGEVVSAIVKLPFRVAFTPAVGGRATPTPALAAVLAQAASSGLLAATVSGTGTCDTQQR